jgi:hypothetical protein
MKSPLTLSLVLALGGALAAAQQVCIATTASVAGSYAYTATQMPVPGAAVAVPPNPTTPSYSNTTIGQLIENINGGGAFGSAAVFYLDGAGNIAVVPSPLPAAGLFVNVGTYSVNSDCTINVTLTDVFNGATSGPGVTTPTQASLKLFGLILGGGSEIDLSMPLTASSTHPSTVIIPGQFVSRLNIQMIRSFPYGCSASYLTGAYGLVGNGLALVNGTAGTGNPTSIQPATFYAGLIFDGNTNVLMETTDPTSPLASVQYTGTYKVNADCSGSMSIKSFSLTPGQGPAVSSPTLSVSFVIIPTAAYSVDGTVNLNGNSARAGLLFNFVTAIQEFTGYGRAQ